MTQKTLLILAINLLVLGALSAIAMAQTAVGRMSKEDLKARLSDPKMVVVDVRTSRDWSASEQKIKGAVRIDVRDVLSVVETYDKAKTLVFYCA